MIENSYLASYFMRGSVASLACFAWLVSTRCFVPRALNVYHVCEHSPAILNANPLCPPDTNDRDN